MDICLQMLPEIWFSVFDQIGIAESLHYHLDKIISTLIFLLHNEIDAATFHNTYLDLLPLCKARGEVTVAPLESLVKRI